MANSLARRHVRGASSSFVAVPHSRYCPYREVAAEQCKIGYGAVAVQSARVVTMAYQMRDTDEPDSETIIRTERTRPLFLSWEMTGDDNDTRGFIDRETARLCRQERGDRTRVHLNLKNCVGATEALRN